MSNGPETNSKRQNPAGQELGRVSTDTLRVGSSLTSFRGRRTERVGSLTL
jgi:hypothetical protein